MREIKFRAWSTKDKKMYHFDDKHLIVMGRQNSWSFGEPSWDWEMEEGTDETDGILMQYTGLKDANGKEIYEGDILQWSDGDMTIGVVEWLEGDICFDIDFLNLGGFKTKPTLNGFNSDKVKGYKVIGNIYENPELLESNGQVK